VNPTDDWQRYVSHGYSAWSAAPERSEMSVSVNDEIRRSPIEDDAQLAIAEHPIFGERFPTEGRGGRCEVKRRDAHIGVKRQQRTLQAFTLAPGPDGKSLEGPRVDRRWPLIWPEAATTAGRAGDANPRPVRQAHYGGATIQHLDAVAFQRAPECNPAQRSQVVVTKHRDHGQSSRRQELAGRLGFQQAPVLREVPGDKQEVGVLRKTGQTRYGTRFFSSPDVEVANRGDSHR
jgi:hypothetical protein